MHRHRRTLAIALCLATGISTGAVARQDDDASPKRVDQRVADLSPLSLSLREVNVNLRQSNDFSELYEIPGLDGIGARYMRSSGALHAVFDRSTYDPRGSAQIPSNTTFYIGTPPVSDAADAAPDTRIGAGNVHNLAIPPALAYSTPGAGAARLSLDASNSVRTMAAVTLNRDGRELSSFTRSIRVDGSAAPPPSIVHGPATAPDAFIVAAQPSDSAPPPRAKPDPAEHPTYVNDREYRSSRIHDLLRRAAQEERRHQSEDRDDVPRSEVE